MLKNIQKHCSIWYRANIFQGHLSIGSDSGFIYVLVGRRLMRPNGRPLIKQIHRR